MKEYNKDWADRLGKQCSNMFIAALATMFAYGYLIHFG
jgi:hypothetical protein